MVSTYREQQKRYTHTQNISTFSALDEEGKTHSEEQEKTSDLNVRDEPIINLKRVQLVDDTNGKR